MLREADEEAKEFRNRIIATADVTGRTIIFLPSNRREIISPT